MIMAAIINVMWSLEAIFLNIILIKTPPQIGPLDSHSAKLNSVLILNFSSRPRKPQALQAKAQVSANFGKRHNILYLKLNKKQDMLKPSCQISFVYRWDLFKLRVVNSKRRTRKINKLILNKEVHTQLVGLTRRCLLATCFVMRRRRFQLFFFYLKHYSIIYCFNINKKNKFEHR